MEIQLANPRGFCAGVDRAIEIVERALELFGAPIYVRHEVVHNRFVVDRLADLGAVFVEELDDVPDNATVIFSAHGVSQDVRKAGTKRGLKVFDATCPLVTKVHLELARHCKAGRDAVLIDDLAYVTQTTLSVDDTQGVIAALREKFPSITGPKHDDICYATQNRQDAVKDLAREADLMLVVGSVNSSNSNRLRELAEKQGVPSYLIDGAEDIRPEWLIGIDHIGVTAGASAPESLVTGVIDKLREQVSATVSEADGVDEHMEFALPKELRVKTLG
jgi:4-hydroxy-3-methylbut-2-enyl diphosphate reductase